MKTICVPPIQIRSQKVLGTNQPYSGEQQPLLVEYILAKTNTFVKR